MSATKSYRGGLDSVFSTSDVGIFDDRIPSSDVIAISGYAALSPYLVSGLAMILGPAAVQSQRCPSFGSTADAL